MSLILVLNFTQKSTEGKKEYFQTAVLYGGTYYTVYYNGLGTVQLIVSSVHCLFNQPLPVHYNNRQSN